MLEARLFACLCLRPSQGPRVALRGCDNALEFVKGLTMALPNFLIIGAMKAGTSWLADMLDEHPEIYVAKDELHFFNDDAVFGRGVRWYERRFRRARTVSAIGEKTAGYLLSTEALDRIAEVLPDVKLIAVFRDPVRRAISQVNHHIRYGEMPAPSAGEDFLTTERLADLNEIFAVTDRGLYRRQLQQVYARFTPDRLLVLINEIDIGQRPRTALAEVCRFLDVDDGYDFRRADELVHATAAQSDGAALSDRARGVLRRARYRASAASLYEPSTAEISSLHSLYKHENTALFEMLGRQMPAEWTYGR